MFKYQNITFGADPELFLRHKKTGAWVPACGLIGGTKKKPKGIGKRGHFVQEDNVMVEFNIPPARKADQVVASIHYVLDHLKHRLPHFDLVIQASAEFNPEDLAKHPKAMEFGCEPDYDAWNMLINDAPSRDTNIRTSGGHEHTGYDGASLDNQVTLIRAYDLFKGVPLVVLDPDKIRKTRYGKAGAFRPKDYGVEYRVPSNHWISSPELIKWMFSNTHKAIHFLNEGNSISDILGKEIQHIINTGDEQRAMKLCKEFNTLEGI